MRIISRWPTFSLGCRKPLVTMAPSLVPFCSAFILDETSDICFRYVEPFRSYVLAIDGGPRKLRIFPRRKGAAAILVAILELPLPATFST